MPHTPIRLRRLKRTFALRTLAKEIVVSPSKFIVSISSPLDTKTLDNLAKQGISGIFVEESNALNASKVAQAREYGFAVFVSATSFGDSDAKNLREKTSSYAQAGCDSLIIPFVNKETFSEIRSTLDEDGFQNTLLMPKVILNPETENIPKFVETLNPLVQSGADMMLLEGIFMCTDIISSIKEAFNLPLIVSFSQGELKLLPEKLDNFLQIPPVYDEIISSAFRAGANSILM